MILREKKLLKHFKKKYYKKKTNIKKFELEMLLREKAINHMLNGKDTIICLIAG